LALQEIDPKSAREIMAIYGAPTSGKTRLATSLPERFGKLLYIPFDEGGEGLMSVMPQYQKRITVIKPDGTDPQLGVVRDLFDLYTTKWDAKGYNTIILDTMSRLTYTVLDLVASDKVQMVRQGTGRRLGEPGKPGFVQLADEAHYGAMNGVVLNFVSNLINLQPTMNIIFVCHEQAADDKSMVGGPGFAGRAVGKWLPTLSQNAVIRVARTETSKIDKSGVVEKTVKRVAWVAPHGTWIARRAENSIETPIMDKVDLDRDPINFWVKYDESKGAV
jgi:hypothetical protein